MDYTYQFAGSQRSQGSQRVVAAAKKRPLPKGRKKTTKVLKNALTALRMGVYRLGQLCSAQARAYALTRARRCGEERGHFVNTLVSPVGKKKWDGKKKGAVCFAHYCLPLWLQGTVVEKTHCGADGDLVLVKISMKPALPAFFVASDGDLSGGRDPSTPGRIPRIPQGKTYMAVPKNDLWMST